MAVSVFREWSESPPNGFGGLPVSAVGDQRRSRKFGKGWVTIAKVREGSGDPHEGTGMVGKPSRTSGRAFPPFGPL